MLVATFNSRTGWAGKRITREGDSFVLEGEGPVTSQNIMEFDARGEIDWSNDGTRAWIASLARAGRVQPGPVVPAQPQPTSAQKPVAVSPQQAAVAVEMNREAKTRAIMGVVGLVVLIIVGVWACAACSPSNNPSGSTSSGSVSDDSGSWTQVFVWRGGGSGNDIRNSSPFTFEGGHQQIHVSSLEATGEWAMPVQGWTLESADGGGQWEMVNPAAFGESDSDLYLPAGTYYLSSNTIDCTWALTVSEMR